MKAFNQLSQSAVYREDDVSVSLTVCGGSYGGSEVLIVDELSDGSDSQSVGLTGQSSHGQHRDLSND